MFWYFSYFSTKTYVVGTLEMPQQGPSNEYPQHMFSKGKCYIDTPSYLEWWWHLDPGSWPYLMILDQLQIVQLFFHGVGVYISGSDGLIMCRRLFSDFLPDKKNPVLRVWDNVLDNTDHRCGNARIYQRSLCSCCLFMNKPCVNHLN